MCGVRGVEAPPEQVNVIGRLFAGIGASSRMPLPIPGSYRESRKSPDLRGTIWGSIVNGTSKTDKCHRLRTYILMDIALVI